MITIQQEIILPKFNRGFHLITDQILNSIQKHKALLTGIAHIFLQHTSASISINENSDPNVREDMESYFNDLVGEDKSYYKHILEGPDDMPAHIKSSLIGNSLIIPISNGKLNLGIWQGVYLCEHRNNAIHRKLIITMFGEK